MCKNGMQHIPLLPLNLIHTPNYSIFIVYIYFNVQYALLLLPQLVFKSKCVTGIKKYGTIFCIYMYCNHLIYASNVVDHVHLVSKLY